MTTPLEAYLLKLKESGRDFGLNTDNMIIGEDNAGSSLLRDGMVTHFPVGPRVANLPNSLAFYLYSTDQKWKEDLNSSWLKTSLTTYAPVTVFVFHANCAAALLTHGVNSDATFSGAYRGNRSSTFNEVMAVLAAGYTKATVCTHGCYLRKS